MRRTIVQVSRLCIFTTLAALAAPFAAAAEQPENPAKKAYLTYCGACHGETGKGDGVAGTFMRPKPTDLTQLAKNAGGDFPATRLTQVLEGRAQIDPHGKADLPVWGELFREEAAGNLAGEAAARGKMQLIIQHLRAIQAK
jgi:mono/diheme cytochrome c family protein